jgi:hypothetical protein
LSKLVDPKQKECSLTAMSQDILGLIFQKVALLDRDDGDPCARMSVLVTCKRFMRVALERAYPPWGDGGRGLEFALERGFYEYFAQWSMVAGARWKDQIRMDFCCRWSKRAGFTHSTCFQS